LSMVSGSVECMTSNGPQVSCPSWSWDDPHSDRKLRVWSRPSICKDLVYLQHKTSSGWTNCFWKNHTTCCLGTGWLFLSMMKWWRSINPVMVMTTSHLLHTVWVANLVAAMAITWWSNLNEASFELCWQPDSWDTWHQHCNLGTGKVKHMRNDSAYLLDLRLGMDNMQMHLSGDC
jgi:hypothetical protein